MLKTLQIKLLANEDQKQVLIDTFIKFNDACNYVSAIVWDRRIFNKILVQKIV